MKKINLLAVLIFMLIASIAQAQTPYTLTDADVVVTSEGVLKSCSYNFANTDIIIPERLDGFIVKEIGTFLSSGVFSNNGITSVVLPSTLRVINAYSFHNNNLSSITLPNSIQAIYGYAFVGNASLTSYTLPTAPNRYTYNWTSRNVSYSEGDVIPASDFYESYVANPTFSGVRISGQIRGGDNVNLVVAIDGTDISSSLPTYLSSFDDGEDYEFEVDLGVDVNIIALQNSIIFTTKTLTETNIQTDVEDFDFYNSYVITDADVVVNSDGVLISTSYNFDRKDIIIPDILDGETVKVIGIENPTNNAVFEDKEIVTVEFPTTLESIQTSAFRNNNLKEIVLPNTVTKINRFAFNRNNIKAITFSTKLEAIDQGAFAFNEISTINLPNSITHIGSEAFKYNSGFSSFNLPTSPTLYTYNWSDGSNSFSEGQSVSDLDVNYDANATFLGARITGEIRGSNGVTLTITGADNRVLTLDNEDSYKIEVPKGSNINIAATKNGVAFTPSIPYDFTNLQENHLRKDFYIPHTVTDNEVYVNSNGLLSGYTGSAVDIIIPSVLDGQTVKAIQSYTFKSQNLKSVILPTKVENIERDAFNENDINEIVLPGTLSHIGSYAFANNVFTSFTLPIHHDPLYTYSWSQGGNSFNQGDIVSVLDEEYTSTESFHGVRIQGQIRGVDGVDLYVTKGGNTSVHAVLNDGESYTIETAVNSSLTIIPIKNGQSFNPSPQKVFSNIQVDAVNQDFYIPYTLTDADVVVDANGMITSYTPPTQDPVDIVIPDNLDGVEVKSIGDPANQNRGIFEFGDLKTVQLPTRLEAISYRTFKGCDLLSIYLPNTVTYIGAEAFKDNPNFTSFTLPSPTSSNADFEYRWEDSNGTSKNANDVITDFDLGYEAIRTSLVAYISGNIRALGSTTISASNGSSLNVTDYGPYSIKITKGETGTVTLTNSNSSFSPASYSYNNIQSDVANIEFTAQYSITYHNLLTGTNHANNPSTFLIHDNSALEDPNRLGYTFTGWFDGISSSNEITNLLNTNLDLYARWTPINYSINYSVTNEGTSSNPNVTNYTIEDTDITLSALSRFGYDFSGWFTDAGFTTPAGAIAIPNGSNGDITFYSKFTPQPDHVVTYHNVNGVTNVNPTSYSPTITSPISLQGLSGRTGYNFVGWYRDSGLSTSITDIQATDGVLDLYAKWEPINYTISFNVTNSSGASANSNPVTYTIETADITLSNLTKSGNNFLGWFTNPELTNAVSGVAIPVGSTGNITFYSRFYSQTNSQITYNNVNGVTNPNQATYSPGITSPITLQRLSGRTGYTFVGWFTDAGLTNQKTEINYSDGDITLYAKWDATVYTIAYSINNSSSVTNNNPTSYTIESSDISLSDVSIPGYNFGGWYTDSGLTSKVNSVAIPTGSTGNITVYAKWDAIVYTISYTINNGSGVTNSNPTSYTIESSNITLSNPSKSGHYFSGWFTNSGLTSAVSGVAVPTGSTGNKTFYSNFLADYVITFHNVEGATNPNQATYSAGSTTAITLQDLTGRDGYTFEGWFRESAFTNRITEIEVADGDIAIYAKWSKVITSVNTALLNSFKVYPNPTTGKELYVDINGISEKAVVKVYTTRGVLISSNEIYTREKINFDVPSGIYMINISTSVGEKTFKVLKN
ncbi:InlB B-repeat-containing protein [Flammeovirga kamogawensis]|uniref:InlB B-repeat-containing protein n=1 Tax=Flammeovirga kamogawensis TaxID=373891 RepID=A0ABX8H4V9_9BACT|nr:InlB B-repeat-containing protein [Flammeovirga kamogawensis]MBB6461924.1 putative repeat protein (TIGR02543 family) [Flammeovirga kamogawensis]QWG10467.1 InlB B-repeat-containing protein [Flammeovirga kamogawensis]